MPVAKGVGSEVLMGTVNKEGLLHIRATRVGSDTTLAAITRLVTESQVWDACEELPQALCSWLRLQF